MRRLLSVLGLFWCGLACASLPRDSLARLDYTALVNHWGHVLDGYGYGYDFLGLRTNITRDLGLTNSSVAVGYDSVGQLTSWQAREGLTNAIRLNEQNGWAYDAAGNLRYRTNGGLIQTFNCDSLNQLTNVTRNSTMTVSGATPAPAASVTVNGVTAQTYGDFTFAATNQNLLNGANTFTIIAQNGYGIRVTNSLNLNLPASVALLSDANGNLTNDGTCSFAYSPENQLTNITVAGAWKSDFVFDGLGRRRIERDYGWQGSNWTKTNELHFIYDGLQLIQVRDGSNNVLVTYTRGLDLSGSLAGAGGIGGLLARTDGNGSIFYHADGAGNITALMDGQQNMAARHMYDPFGKPINQQGPMANTDIMGFSSMPVHRLSGLVHFHGREYATIPRRWLTQDPIGEAGGINLYGFVGNNPLSYVDPYGDDFHVVGASGILTPGPLGYLSGDTALENLAAGGYNTFPEVGNIVANATTAVGQAVEGLIDSSKWLTRALGGSPSDEELVGAAVNVGSLFIGGPEARLGKLRCAAKTGADSALQGARLGEHLRQLETYGQAGFKELENGSIRYYGNLKPASTPGEMSGARLVREWTPETGAKRTWIETLDQSGKVRSVRPETGGPKVHYIFDANGNYTGTR